MGRGIFATAVRAQCSCGILQLMVYVAICTNISISSPRRDKCILSQMNTSESALAAVQAWRCSSLCWKDELSDGARTGGTDEIKSRQPLYMVALTTVFVVTPRIVKSEDSPPRKDGTVPCSSSDNFFTPGGERLM